MTTQMTKVEPGSIEINETEAGAIRLTNAGIAAIAFDMEQAEKLVTRVLERGIDYGQLPGTPAPCLWDPGASKIINAFNAYPDYKILHKVEGDGLLSTTIQSILVFRRTGMVVGTGIGSASTRETKYKYRWVTDPENYGYSPEEAKSLKTRPKGNALEYRITNPEYGELANTIDKMAAKRADVDAAESLPGVKSALRKLFEGKGTARKQPDWEAFWGRIRQMGLLERDVHELLEVKSMTEWTKQGKTLEDAIKTIAEKLASRNAPKSAQATETQTTNESEGKEQPNLWETEDEPIPQTLPDLLTWVAKHGKEFTPSWLYKETSTRPEQLQNPDAIRKVYLEVKAIHNW